MGRVLAEEHRPAITEERIPGYSPEKMERVFAEEGKMIEKKSRSNYQNRLRLAKLIAEGGSMQFN